MTSRLQHSARGPRTKDKLIHQLHSRIPYSLLYCADLSYTWRQAYAVQNNDLRSIAARCAAIDQHSLRTFSRNRGTKRRDIQRVRAVGFRLVQLRNTNSELT
jgi:hypothetical protein